MSDGLYNRMAYSYMKQMWHRMGIVSETPRTAGEVMTDEWSGGFPIITRPVTVSLNGEETVWKNMYAIIRGKYAGDQTEEILGHCTGQYKPLQPADIADTFDQRVNEYCETMGILHSGKEMFISWKMPEVDLVSGDKYEMYGIVRVGFTIDKGARLFTSIYRPVCANTLTAAQGWAKRNKSAGKSTYRLVGKGTNPNLLENLGHWMAHVQGNALAEAQTMKELFGFLSKKPIKSEVEARTLLFEAFPPKVDHSGEFPKELKSGEARKVADENEKREKIRDGIYAMFSGQGTAITPNRLGLLNATTEYTGHYMMSRKDIADSVMWGNRADINMSMVQVLRK